jgi:hypothetical protein
MPLPNWIELLIPRKQELESLLEKGVLSDLAFDNITAMLPAESPLSGSSTVHGANNGLNSPSPTPSASTASSVNNTDRATTPIPQNHNAPPPLPGQSPAPNSKPVLRHARAVYRYAATDARDCSFEKDDRIAVFEYMNADWWMGQNLRTGDEGIFPRTYVALEPSPPSGMDMDEKRDGSVYPQAGNPYNAAVPPMAVAEQGGGGVGAPGAGNGRLEQGAKRFGKKLGNAAIFGAGMTIGSDIVNSIL